MTDDGEIDALIEKHGLPILIERCCEAKEGSRELNSDIARALGDDAASIAGTLGYFFTQNFESARALKPAGYRIQLDEYPDGWTVVLWPTADCPHPALGGVTNGASSPTAALAITIACLRVRLALATKAKP